MGLHGDDKNQSSLKIAKPEMLLDIIIVTDFTDSAGLEAWGIPGQRGWGGRQSLPLSLAMDSRKGATAHAQVRLHLHSPRLSCPVLCKLSQTAALPRGRRPAGSI